VKNSQAAKHRKYYYNIDMNKLSLLLLFLVSFATIAKNSKYNRKEWSHWADENKNCINTRNEILKSRSLVPVQMKPSGCAVLTGKWKDYYYAEVLTDSKKIDIDHLIPLKHAYEVGGAVWPKEMKKQFANDPENLVITNRRYNRQKGAKTISEWLPVDPSYACKYYKDWMNVKKKYQLHIAEEEIKAINFDKLKHSCL
jgi:hypothetical protein